MKIQLACLIAAVVLQQHAMGQIVYQLPFASSGNTIELAVSNSSVRATSNVTVSLQDAPDWLQFIEREHAISSLAAGEEQSTAFVFSVAQSAPVGVERALTFKIGDAKGESWTKEIRVSVSPPERFELFQNYPNPFNPTTAISYQLPAGGQVSLRIYNLIGQEVTVLVDEERPAGFHTQSWNASAFPSGMYIYQLTAQSNGQERRIVRKTMMLIK